jgi:hypothetical protein
VAIAGQLSDAEYVIKVAKAERSLMELRRGFPLTVKESARLIANLAYSGQKLIRFLMIGKYCYDANVELLCLDRTKGARMRAVKMISQPDLMRYSIFMDFRASEVEFINTLKNYEHISADLFPVIFEYSDTCKHFMQRDRS